MKPSFINSTLYGPQAVIGDSVGPAAATGGCVTTGSCVGPHRQQMYALWIPVAVIEVWVGPIGSYKML